MSSVNYGSGVTPTTGVCAGGSSFYSGIGLGGDRVFLVDVAGITPSTGSLAITGLVGTIRAPIVPLVGALSLTGYVPVVSSLDKVIVPAGAAILLTGIAPTVVAITETYVDAEVPSGTINGSNDTFTLAHAPSPAGSLELFRNGLFMTAGGVDYTLTGSTIVFGALSIPQTGDTLICWYRY